MMGLVPSSSLLLTLLLLLLNPHCAHPEYITSSEVNLVAQGTHEFIMHTVPETNMTFLHSVTVDIKALGWCSQRVWVMVDIVSGVSVSQTVSSDGDSTLVVGASVADNVMYVTITNTSPCSAAVSVTANLYLEDADLHTVVAGVETGKDYEHTFMMVPEASMVQTVRLTTDCEEGSYMIARAVLASPPVSFYFNVSDSNAVVYNVGDFFVPGDEGSPTRNYNYLSFTDFRGNCYPLKMSAELVCTKVSIPGTQEPEGPIDTAVPYTYAPWVIRPQGEPRLKVWVYVAVGVGAVVVGFAAVCYCSRRVDVEGQYSEGV